MQTEPSKPTSYFAPLVFTGAGNPLREGVVTIAGGKIQSVEPYRQGMQVTSLENCAIIPPLVNAHTHLEFSSLSQPFPADESFATWIQQVVQWRREQSQSEDYITQRQQAIVSGLDESAAAGVAALGDIVTSPWFAMPYNRDDIHAVQFLELLGVSEERVKALSDEAAEHLRTTPGTNGLHPALSPHSPYTTTPEVVGLACELSCQTRTPIAMHLAETREELSFLHDRSGPLAEMLEAAGMWQEDAPPAGCRPLDYLQQLVRAHRALVVHGNYLTTEEIGFIGRNKQQLTVAYCPRTHTHFGHEPYPLQAMLDAGVRVALGTDSRASNPDLSLWEEVKHVHQQHPTIAPQELLKMATANGAYALQMEDEMGTLKEEMGGVFTVIRLPPESSAKQRVAAGDVWGVLFSETATAEGMKKSTPDRT